MISSIPSASKPGTADLLSAQEEDILNDLLNYITNRTNQAKQNLINTLSKLISTSYYLGGDKAAKEIGGPTGPLGLKGLTPVLEKVGTSLDSTFGSMSGELTGIIKGGVESGWSFPRVKKALAEKINSGWGKSIKFDSTGTTRKFVKVAPDGTLSWGEKTITQSITLPTKVYADTLARTSMKQAYTAGHFERYQTAGYKGWVYLSVADERTRPTHLALHGRVFLFGTPEEEMAREVMKENNCRCRPKAWFDDQKLDRPDYEYRDERRKWARQALEERPANEDENDETRKYLQEIASDDNSEKVIFKPAAKLADAEKWVEKATKIKQVDYKGIDVKAANQVNESLAFHINLDRRIETNLDYVGTCQSQMARSYEHRLTARVATIKKMYPEMDSSTVRKLAERGVTKEKVPGKYFAWYARPLNVAGIGVNKRWCTDLDALEEALKQNIETKFHPEGCTTMKSLVDHEFGHALDDIYKFRDMDDIASEYKDLCSLGNDKAGKALSIYGMKNKKEFIAEAWSEYLNNPTPRPVAKKIGGIMERTIKEAQKKL